MSLLNVTGKSGLMPCFIAHFCAKLKICATLCGFFGVEFHRWTQEG